MKRLIFLILLLTGCESVPIAPPAPLAQCNQMCFTPCVEENGSTGIVWEATGEDAKDWDFLAGSVVVDLVAKLKQCDKGRDSCVKCLKRLQDENIIKL